MFLQRGSRAVRAVQRRCSVASGSIPKPALRSPARVPRCFHTTRRLEVVKPVLLADIGEGKVPQPTNLANPSPL